MSALRAQYSDELLEAARDGDERAIASLLEIAQPDLRRYAQRACAATDHVNDAVQETLWIISRRIGTLRTVASFAGWMLAVVRHECGRLARRMTGKSEDLEGLEALAALARRPSFELRIDLARAIQSLPDHYREVVILRDVDGRTIGEIASALGRSRGAIKAILNRARMLLREYLTQ